MKRSKPSRLVRVGWVLLIVTLIPYLISLATGYVSVYNWDPVSRVVMELYGRPWCMDHRYPVPMYEGHVYELTHADLGDVHAGLYSPWRCPICGTKSVNRNEFWMWIHGRNEMGGRLIVLKKVE